jgi:hypothetical protein
MKRAALLLMLAVMLVLAMLMSPASGQITISPEVTPEATVEVMPPGFEWVMRAPGICSLSQDESLVAIVGGGLYNLSTGEQLIEFEPKPEAGRVYSAYFSEDILQVIVDSDGVYDIESGQKIADFPEDSVLRGGTPEFPVILAFGEETWTETMYDSETWTPVFDPFTYGMPTRLIEGYSSESEIQPGIPGIHIYGDILLTYDLNELTANVYDFDTKELLYTRIFDGFFTVDATNAYIAVPGEDIRTLRDNEVIIDDLPVFTVVARGRTTFSEDSSLVLVENPDAAVFYSLPNGEKIAEVPLNTVSGFYGDFSLSDDGRSIIITRRYYQTDQLISDLAYTIDVASGEIIDWPDESPLTMSFTPDGRYKILDDGIYDAESGELIVALNPQILHGVHFNTDFTLAAKPADGVYDLVAKHKLYVLPNSAVMFSPDSRFIWVQKLGVLDAQTGELLYAMPGKGYYSFSASSKYLTTSGYQSCNILALPEAQE